MFVHGKYNQVSIGGLLAATALTLAMLPAHASDCPSSVSKANAVQVAPVETVQVTDDVYSKINTDVITPTPITPQVVAPVDVLKEQINARMNGGLMAGSITNEHADEIREMLDAISLQEANFKLSANGCLTQPEANNLIRKYEMINQRLDYLFSVDVVPYMPSFILRRAGLQRRIHYHVAAGDISPVEGEQLLNALSAVSDEYDNDRATGGALTASELESLHRDLSEVFAKLSERCGAKLAFVAPASYDKLAELKKTLSEALASNKFSEAEAKNLSAQYKGLVLMQDCLSQGEGLHAADLALLAKQIDDLNFILTRELRDRQIAGRSDKL